VVAKSFDRAEQQRRFMALETKQRRAVMRAVNRGQAVEVRTHAPMAVAVAQRQLKFWKWAWLLGPALGAFQLLVVPLEAALLNAGLATLGLGVVSFIWYRRADRAERLNRDIFEGRRAPGPGGAVSDTGTHLPGERPRPKRSSRGASSGEVPGGDHTRPTAGAANDERASGSPPAVPGLKPYRPRGRKRRGKR
jgi:hypothetical protein